MDTYKYMYGMFFFFSPITLLLGFLLIMYKDLQDEKRTKGIVEIDFFIKKIIKLLILSLFLAFIFEIFRIKGVDPKEAINYFLINTIK